MNIYDANTGELLESPDLEAGYLVEGERVTGYKLEVMDGTITEERPEGLRQEVPVTEACKYYYVYTDEEKKQIKSKKLQDLSNSCNDAINNGADVQLYGGVTKHFSYTIEDQSNISEMFNAVIMGATAYPYHANSEFCEMYSAQDIVTIYATLSSLKTAQTTYHNMLKQYVMTLNSVPSIQEVTYGQELTGEYLEKYNELVEAANEQMQIVLSKAAQYTV